MIGQNIPSQKHRFMLQKYIDFSSNMAKTESTNPLKNERVIRKSNTVQKSTLSALGMSRFTTPIAPDLSTLTTSVLKVRL